MKRQHLINNLRKGLEIRGGETHTASFASISSAVIPEEAKIGAQSDGIILLLVLVEGGNPVIVVVTSVLEEEWKEERGEKLRCLCV